MAGLSELVESRRLPADSRVVYLHMGGTPAIHEYSSELWPDDEWSPRTPPLHEAEAVLEAIASL